MIYVHIFVKQLLFRTTRWAVDVFVFVDELLTQHRFKALQTLEAVYAGVPVSVFIGNPFGIRRYPLFTGLTGFGESFVVTIHAIRFPIASHVFLSAERGVTSQTTKVLQMPILLLGLRVFLRENQLKEQKTRKI